MIAASDTQQTNIPYNFVLDHLTGSAIRVRSLFGSYSIYDGEKIVLVLRNKTDYVADNGVWVATTKEHHQSLKEDFPSMRSISMFTDGVSESGWQLLPADSDDFESSVLNVCELISKGDQRIGKIPKPRKKKNKKA